MATLDKSLLLEMFRKMEEIRRVVTDKPLQKEST